MTTRSFDMAYGYPKEMEIAKKERWPILIPIGTMEYHSTICPYGCDSLVSMGIAREIAKELDCVIMPPVWYGVASYAVGGPETGTIHVDCDTFEQYVYCILKSLFLAGFNRNIYMVISHQTEDHTEDDLLYDPGESRIEEHSADRRQYDSDHHQYDEHRGDVDELVVMPHRDDDEQCDTCGDRDVQDVLENDTDDGHQYGDAQCHPVQFHGRTVHLLCIEWILLVCTLGYIFVGHRHYNFVLE